MAKHSKTTDAFTRLLRAVRHPGPRALAPTLKEHRTAGTEAGVRIHLKRIMRRVAANDGGS